MARWLPVPYDCVSPDGPQFTYADSSHGLYIVDARSFATREVATDSQFQVLEWRNDGIYVMKNITSPNGYTSFRGLYLINPTVGSVQTLTTDGDWQKIGAQAAWGIAAEPT